MAGGEEAAAVLVGGPSGTMIARDTFDRKLTFDDLATGRRDHRLLAASGTSWRSSNTTCPSSCTKAAATARPAGSATCSCKRRSAKFRKGLANPEDIDYLKDLSATIIETSRCGLGMTSPNPILSTLENFPLVYSAMLKPSEDRIRATFDIQSAIDGCPQAGQAPVLHL